jgi:hypothetical protein
MNAKQEGNFRSLNNQLHAHAFGSHAPHIHVVYKICTWIRSCLLALFTLGVCWNFLQSGNTPTQEDKFWWKPSFLTKRTTDLDHSCRPPFPSSMCINGLFLHLTAKKIPSSGHWCVCGCVLPQEKKWKSVLWWCKHMISIFKVGSLIIKMEEIIPQKHW